MNMQRLISIFAIICSLALIATSANAITRTVDCDKGQSVNAAINKGLGSAEPLTINVSGTCAQTVNIRRDDVTINGINNPIIDGTIHVDDSIRVTISNLTITGDSQGVRGTGSNVVLINVIVIGNQDVGIQFFWSNVYVDNATVKENQGFTGIQVGRNSTLHVTDSVISYNNGNGISLDLNSMLDLSNSSIESNSAAGIYLSQNSSASINGGSIKDNDAGIVADMHSVLELEEAKVSGNGIGIYLTYDSAARLRAGTTITDNGAAIDCYDAESSYEDLGGTVTGLINCTDFNQ